MDALSEIISFLKPKAAITGITEGYSPWGILFSHYDYVKFAFVSEGQCWLKIKKMKDILLEEGDAWILIRPMEFRIGSEADGPSVSSTEFFKEFQTRHVAGKKASQSLKSVLFGGGIYFDSANASLILDNLPSVIILKKKDVSDSLKNMMTILQHESQNSSMGSHIVIETLIQLVFVEALRTMDLKSLKIGILKGLGHPEISKVINAIHKDIKRDWTVQDLAKIVGASRSNFAAKFKSTVGMSPMEYLQLWRMTHAQAALRNSDERISDIAYSVGYESVTAFSTAFSKVVGKAPKAFREKAQT